MIRHPQRNIQVFQYPYDYGGPEFIVESRRKSIFTEDSGRTSLGSSIDTPPLQQSHLEFDSGVDERSESQIQRPQTLQLTLSRLNQCTTNFVLRLGSIVSNSEFFFHVAKKESKNARDLLDELEGKLKRPIVHLDEDAVEFMDEIKRDVDICRITDHRLSALLTYSEFCRQIREILEKLMHRVLDPLEKNLSLYDRGARGVPNRYRSMQSIALDLTKSAQRLQANILEEGKSRIRN